MQILERYFFPFNLKGKGFALLRALKLFDPVLFDVYEVCDALPWYMPQGEGENSASS
jgi:hypothetical protein